MRHRHGTCTCPFHHIHVTRDPKQRQPSHSVQCRRGTGSCRHHLSPPHNFAAGEPTPHSTSALALTNNGWTSNTKSRGAHLPYSTEMLHNSVRALRLKLVVIANLVQCSAPIICNPAPILLPSPVFQILKPYHPHRMTKAQSWTQSSRHQV